MGAVVVIVVGAAVVVVGATVVVVVGAAVVVVVGAAVVVVAFVGLVGGKVGGAAVVVVAFVGLVGGKVGGKVGLVGAAVVDGTFVLFPVDAAFVVSGAAVVDVLAPAPFVEGLATTVRFVRATGTSFSTSPSA